jgi:hypothetical protein
MALYLVVAHQTAASPELLEKLKEIDAEDADAEFVLLVPATPVGHLLTWTEGESQEVARTTAWDAAHRLRDAGLSLVDIVIGAGDPLLATEDEHRSRGRPYEATIVSTLPLGVSRWLKRDLPNRLHSKLGIDVIHVISREPARKPAVA